jgi:tetratricopeptide (TPR) repeat protein
MRIGRFVIAGLLALSPAVVALDAQNGAADAVLAPLERALASSPDDLKAGNDYRMAVIDTKQHDRAIAFFEQLVAAHPAAANAHLNFGFAYVDKIPVAGSITQVILANNALNAFTKSLEGRSSWIGYYTRGNSYLFWPKIFNRTKLGVADLEEALRLQRAEPRRSYHVRTFVALGDGYWKMDEPARAVATWREGLEAFPDSVALARRLEAEGEALKALLDAEYDPSRRVDTRLDELWGNR